MTNNSTPASTESPNTPPDDLPPTIHAHAPSPLEMLDNMAMHIDPSQIANKQVAVVKRSMLDNMFRQIAHSNANDADAVRKTIEEYETKLEKLRREYEDRFVGQRAEFEARIAELQARLEAIEPEMADRQAQLDAARAELEALKTQLAQARAEYKTLESKYERVRNASELIHSLEDRLQESENLRLAAEKTVREYDTIMRRDGRKALAELTEKYTAQSDMLLEHQINDDVFLSIKPVDTEAILAKTDELRARADSIRESISADSNDRSKELVDHAQSLFRRIRQHHNRLKATASEFKSLLNQMYTGKSNPECLAQLTALARELDGAGMMISVFTEALSILETA